MIRVVDEYGVLVCEDCLALFERDAMPAFVDGVLSFVPYESQWRHADNVVMPYLSVNPFLQANVAFSRGTGRRGLCSAQTVTDRTVGYNAWFGASLALNPPFPTRVL